MMNRITDAVKHLIIINVLLYLIAKLVFPQLQDLFALHFPQNPSFGYWQYITNMFMHSQTMFMHIALNMFGVWMFGMPLEQMWGRNKFLFFYISSGLGAGIIYTLVNYYQFNSVYNQLINMGVSASEIANFLEITAYDLDGFKSQVLQILSNNTTIETPIDLGDVIDINSKYKTSAVGASGALYGLLVAFGMSFPNSKMALIFLPIPIKAKYFIPVLILSDLFFGVFTIAGDNIAHFAHIGGAITGLIIMLYWKKTQFKNWN